MKKFFTILGFVLFCLTLGACNGKGNKDNKAVADPVHSDISNSLIFHYNRSDNDYTKFSSLWVWPKDGEGAQYYFSGDDSYGKFLAIDLAKFAGVEEFGFIVRSDSWDKDYDGDRFVLMNKLKADSATNYNVYLKNGDEHVYISANGDLISEITNFAIAEKSGKYTLDFALTVDYKSFTITKNGETFVSSDTVAKDSKATITSKSLSYDLGSDLPSFDDSYELKVVFTSGIESTMGADTSTLYDTKAFTDQYTYTGELGAIYTAAKTTFRVWSPVSSSIKLRIYETGTPASLGGSDTALNEYTMTKGEKGTWEYTVDGDMEGKYYTYVVTNAQFKNKEIVDPYAKSTGINGLRGMVVDFAKTNPTGWDSVQNLGYTSTELTVYETHIADVTSSSTWGGTAENAKTFVGFYEAGTTYTEDGTTVKTGFDHIKELGVNAVQIIPIFDAANDERIENRTFNWGYNPLNYNSLDGIYSKNPYDGYEKIKEFKALVQAYNEAGITIIMDVVYNHVNGASGSNFDVLMPGYYYRYTNGVLSNGSGCGNETASDRAMFRKFMVDSTEFWASEYKLGGFRFDLMGIHDLETMNTLTKNLHEKVAKNITVYGEPWAGGGIAISDSISAKQSNMKKYEGYGCFNDSMRDALIKGGLNAATDKGWITDTKSVTYADAVAIKTGVRGMIQTKVTDTYKTVNYVTCHDNYTLYDRIKAAGITDEDTVKKMAMLANSVVFTSQGITFMLAGEEFLRTKGGNSNSYNASYAVNELDYSLKIKNMDMFENYQKLIALKQNAALFGLTGEQVAAQEVVTISDDSAMISYTITYTNEAGKTVTYVIAHANGVAAKENAPHALDLAGYTLYLDTLNTGKELTDGYALDAYQTIIAYKVEE